MKKKLMMLFLCMMVVLSACGKSDNEKNQEKDNNVDVMESNKTTEAVQEDVTEIVYEGEYASYDINEPMLFIQKGEDETYSIQIGIYRLVQLDNCIGVENGDQLDFSTTEWGEEQEITGTITLDGDIATVTLYAPWSDTWFKDVNKYQYYKVLEGQLPSMEDVYTDDAFDKEENHAESIQDEIARVEEMSREHCDIDSSYMGQQQMNAHSAEWYKLWDDELNSLWSRLSDELDAETKAKVLTEQRAWIKRKEGNATAAGLEAFGGSLQPLLESETAAEMTRARVYVLAGYLAEVRNEAFTISLEIQKSLDEAEPSLEDVFAQFEGQWIFDEERGACVGVERTETCDYGVEGSKWTVWVTGGDLFSDLDVYGYTENNILFKITNEDSDVFYELSFGMEDKLILIYRTSLSLDAINDYDMIVCE